MRIFTFTVIIDSCFLFCLYFSFPLIRLYIFLWLGFLSFIDLLAIALYTVISIVLEFVVYNWPLNKKGFRVLTLLPSSKITYNFWLHKTYLSLDICGGLVPGPLWIPKSMDAQVLYIKWWRLMHAYSWSSASADSQLQIQNSTDMYWKKNGLIGGPTQFKPRLSKGQPQIFNLPQPSFKWKALGLYSIFVIHFTSTYFIVPTHPVHCYNFFFSF